MAGSLTTHVLDTAQGRPAADLAIEVWRFDATGGGRTLVKTTHTNVDGRTDGPLLRGDELEIGIYELIFATPALRQAQEQVAAWMRAAGMTVRRDNVGNLIGRYEAARRGAPTLLLGSHLDTVRNAGKYDGPLDVLRRFFTLLGQAQVIRNGTVVTARE